MLASILTITTLIGEYKSPTVSAIGEVGLFKESFNSGALGNGWQTAYFKTPGSFNLANDVAVVLADAYNSYSLALDDRAAAYNQISTKGYSNITLSYCHRTKNMLPFNFLRLGWRAAQTTNISTTSGPSALFTIPTSWSEWNELDKVGWLNFIWGCDTFALPSTANNTYIQIALFGDTIEGWYGLADDIRITGVPIVVPGSITIEKNSIPDSPQEFNFIFNNTTDFILVDNPYASSTMATSTNYTNYRKFSNLIPGNYLVKEFAAPGWTLSNIFCNSTSTTVYFASSSVAINLKAGENSICTFVNRQ
jgi:hypothetical protein